MKHMVNGKEILIFASMYEYLEGLDFSYRTLPVEVGNIRKVPFIQKVIPFTEHEFTVDDTDRVEIGFGTYVRVSFNSILETPIYLLLEALKEPIYLIYDKIYQGNYTTEGQVYEAYRDTYSDIEFDYKNLPNAEFESILMDLIGDESVQSLLSIGGVYGLVSEHFNNEILEYCEPADVDSEDGFYDATVAFLNDMGASTILDAKGVKEILIDHFNNDVLSKWESQEWQRIYDDEPKE